MQIETIVARLRKHGARCNWQLPKGSKTFPSAYVESWSAPNGREFIVVVQANRLGWNIFTPEQSNRRTEQRRAWRSEVAS